MAAPTRDIGRPDLSWAEGAMAGPWWETSADLLWPTSAVTYARMRNDPQLQAVLNAYLLPILRATWVVDPAGCKAKVVQHVADDLGLSVLGKEHEAPGPARRRGVVWERHLRQALTYLPFGHAVFERRYRQDGDLMRLDSLGPRPQWTLTEIKTNDDGSVREVTQTTQRQPIPGDRLAWYVRGLEGANWPGQSMLRCVYGAWLIKSEVWRVHAGSIRRWGMGVPVVHAPPGGTAAQVQQARDFAAAMRGGDQAGAGLPQGFVPEILGLTGSVPDALAFIEYLDRSMAKMALAGLIELGQTETGSRALGETFLDLFLLSLQAVADEVALAATSGWPGMPGIVTDLVDQSYGEDEPAPRIVCTDVGESYEASADAITALVTAGALTPDGELEGWIRKTWRLPAQAPPPPASEGPPAGPEQPPGAGGPPAPGPGSSAPAGPGAGTTPGQAAPGVAAAGPFRRAVTAIEAASGLDAAGLDAEWQAALGRLTSAYRGIQQVQAKALADQAVEAAQAGRLRSLKAMAADASAGAGVIAEAMTGLCDAAAWRMMDEAARQGRDLSPDQVRPDYGRLKAMAAGRAELLGQRLAQEALRAALQAAPPVMAAERRWLTDAQRARKLDMAGIVLGDQVASALAGLSDRLLTDQLGAALHAAQNEGRIAVLRAAEAAHGPAEYVATEILDGNTCAPCRDIDGHQFADLADAELAYINGGYVRCLGGLRCRGTLIAHWADVPVAASFSPDQPRDSARAAWSPADEAKHPRGHGGRFVKKPGAPGIDFRGTLVKAHQAYEEAIAGGSRHGKTRRDAALGRALEAVGLPDTPVNRQIAGRAFAQAMREDADRTMPEQDPVKARREYVRRAIEAVMQGGLPPSGPEPGRRPGAAPSGTRGRSAVRRALEKAAQDNDAIARQAWAELSLMRENAGQHRPAGETFWREQAQGNLRALLGGDFDPDLPLDWYREALSRKLYHSGEGEPPARTATRLEQAVARAFDRDPEGGQHAYRAVNDALYHGADVTDALDALRNLLGDDYSPRPLLEFWHNALQRQGAYAPGDVVRTPAGQYRTVERAEGDLVFLRGEPAPVGRKAEGLEPWGREYAGDVRPVNLNEPGPGEHLGQQSLFPQPDRVGLYQPGQRDWEGWPASARDIAREDRASGMGAPERNLDGDFILYYVPAGLAERDAIENGAGIAPGPEGEVTVAVSRQAAMEDPHGNLNMADPLRITVSRAWLEVNMRAVPALGPARWAEVDRRPGMWRLEPKGGTLTRKFRGLPPEALTARPERATEPRITPRFSVGDWVRTGGGDLAQVSEVDSYGNVLVDGVWTVQDDLEPSGEYGQGDGTPPESRPEGWDTPISPGGKALASSVRSGIRDSDFLGEGGQGRCELVTARDGTVAIRKRYRSWEGFQGWEIADREYLADRVDEAIGGTGGGAVARGRTPDEVLIGYVPGETEAEWEEANGKDYGRRGWPAEELDTERARRIGLLDYLIDNYDRREVNIVRDEDGLPCPIDHGAAFGLPCGNPGPFRQALAENISHEAWPDRELAAIRQRIEALRPEFEASGRTDWYDEVMERLAAFIEVVGRGYW